MVAISSILPLAGMLVAANAAAVAQPFTPPERYYPSPTRVGQKPTNGPYELFPEADDVPFTPAPVPQRTHFPRAEDASSSKPKTSSKKTSSHKPTSHKTSSATPSATPTPVCGYNNLDTLIAPTPGQTIVQVDDGNYDGTNITVIWCSGAYFKTSSIDTDTWLTYPGALANGNGGGEIYNLGQKPTDGTAQGGYYGYEYNITVYPTNGDYRTGKYDLTVYERTTGYYNANSFQMATVELNFTVNKTNSS